MKQQSIFPSKGQHPKSEHPHYYHAVETKALKASLPSPKQGQQLMSSCPQTLEDPTVYEEAWAKERVQPGFYNVHLLNSTPARVKMVKRGHLCANKGTPVRTWISCGGALSQQTPPESFYAFFFICYSKKMTVESLLPQSLNMSNKKPNTPKSSARMESWHFLFTDCQGLVRTRRV